MNSAASPTIDQIKTLYRDFMTLAVERYNAKGDVMPVLAFAQFQDDGKTAIMELPGPLTLQFFSGPESEMAERKNMLADFIDMVLNPARATRQLFQFPPDAAILITETWVVAEYQDENGRLPDRSGKPQPKDDPRRQEAVTVQVIAATETWMGNSMIGGEPKKAVFDGKCYQAMHSRFAPRTEQVEH
jgi:hypothetical protein